MPIYEYACKVCGEEFELLVRHNTAVVCPACDGAEIEKLLSLPAVQSSATHELAMRAAKRRDRKQGREQTMAQREYEQKHDD